MLLGQRPSPRAHAAVILIEQWPDRYLIALAVLQRAIAFAPGQHARTPRVHARCEGRGYDSLKTKVRPAHLSYALHVPSFDYVLYYRYYSWLQCAISGAANRHHVTRTLWAAGAAGTFQWGPTTSA